MLQVGDTFQTQKSGHVGIIAQVIENDNGSLRVQFEDGRWTTVL